jgi:Zn-dependent protease
VTDPLVAFVWYGAFLVSVTLHEAAHAWLAWRGGDLTAYHGGQVSLDPRPHVRREPFGMVVLPLASLVFFGWPFGFASTPYDPRWAWRHPRRAAWMSLGGPAANAGLVLTTALAMRAGLSLGTFVTPGRIQLEQVVAGAGGALGETAALALSVLFSLNLILCLLNLIPLPPLDGAGALPLLLPAGLARRVQQWLAQPLLAWVGILLAWNLFGFVFRPVFLAAVNVLHPGAHVG